MRAPKAITENEKTMSQELINLSKRTQDILFDKRIDDITANAAIDAFNKKWMAAGGHPGSCIVNR